MVRTVRVYSGATLFRILFPVALCMIFVGINVKLRTFPGNRSPTIVYGLFNSYHTEKSGAITIYLMLFVIVTTSFGVFCYIKKFYKVIKVYIIANSVGLLVIYTLLHFQKVATACSIPLSLPTAIFLVFQFGGLGVISIHWKTHKRLHQFYLVMLAALTSIFLLNFLPDWTVWLAISAISIWDLIAVCTPCGPLKLLLKTARKRGDEHFPATLYTTSSYVDTPATMRSNNTEMTEFPSSSNPELQSLVTTPEVAQRTREIREVEGKIRLGMGDFVFYSLMLGNTVQTCPMTTSVACFVSNLVGLTITIPVVSLSQSPLPALPFPLAMAAMFYFSSHIALTPFIDLFTLKLLLF
ncbi:CBN-HOP-1 protein [Caenorhabditis brenneri]|uniref:Presenilin n=1 Tax=Caenorhabditis brenneri TaxID=135651 RepID=G0NJS0_CAEBE|nr:CBN-HOP-1 protein [Caenorhabditis brenneri]